MLNAVIQKFRLAFDDALDDAIDRLTAMLDVAEKVDGGPDLFLDKVLCLFLRVWLIDKLMISRADPESRAAVVSKVDDVLSLDLLDVHLGCDKDRLFSGVLPTRIRIEYADLVDLFIQLVDVASGVLREMLEAM